MNRGPRAGGYVRVGSLLVVIAWVGVALGPDRSDVVLRLCALSLGALVLLFLLEIIRLAHARGRSHFERPPAKHSSPRRPDELVDLERRVALAAGSAFDLHYRVRPLLREAAARRLLTRHGIDLDRDDVAARRLLGEEAWSLLRDDRRPPSDSWAPGMAPEELGRVAEAVSAL